MYDHDQSYNKSMSSIAQLAANNAKFNSTQNNKRGAAIVRTCGEEHIGISSGNSNIFYIPHDNDMCYISDFRFKLILGNGGYKAPSDGGERPGGSDATATPVPTHKFTSVNGFLSQCGPGTVWDMDSRYGAQCWDYACMFWSVMTGRWLITKTGGGVAADCWNYSRTTNAGSEFATSTDWSSIQRGDWVVWDASANHPSTGHIAVALGAPNGDDLETYAQNVPGGWPYPAGGTSVTTYTDHRNGFLGYFRYNKW